MAAEAKPRGQRGRNWTDTEHLALSKAYIRIAEDPVVGNQQTSSSFWKRVHDQATEFGMTPRTERGCQDKWTTIQHDVCKFDACVQRRERLNESGKNDEDHINDAKEDFKRTAKTLTFSSSRTAGCT